MYSKFKTIYFFLGFTLYFFIFNLEEENEKILPYNRYKYLREYNKELCIYLPAQELESSGPISSILVQYGLNVKDFAEKFNKESTIYPAGLRVPVSIFYTMKEKRYNFCFRPLQLKNLFENCVTFDEMRLIYKLHVLDFYKVFKLKKDILNENNDRRLLANILGTLKSFDYPVIIFFDEFDEDDEYSLPLEQINKINTFYVDDYEPEVLEKLDGEEGLEKPDGELEIMEVE